MDMPATSEPMILEEVRLTLEKVEHYLETRGSFRRHAQAILQEIETVLKSVDEEQVLRLIEEIRSARSIVAVGAGRVGMATRGFAMRLAHLGFPTFMLGDATVPSIAEGDLLLASSGSGETQTIYDIVALAKKNGARVALVTGNPQSRMGLLADTVAVLRAPSKTKAVEGLTSIQPMTTLNEQCLGLFFDAVVLEIMAQTGQTHDDMWARHSNLE